MRLIWAFARGPDGQHAGGRGTSTDWPDHGGGLRAPQQGFGGRNGQVGAQEVEGSGLCRSHQPGGMDEFTAELGEPLDQHIGFVLAALQAIAGDLGLDGRLAVDQIEAGNTP